MSTSPAPGEPRPPEHVTHVEHLPARAARHAAWPSWLPDQLAAAFDRRGISAPWQHQVDAAAAAAGGKHVIVATGTASGKSLAYHMTVLSTLLDGTSGALYIAPTKALTADQLAAVGALSLPHIRTAAYDGDTNADERAWARSHGQWIFTNPDMLHHAFLSNHQRWASWFRRLRYVVIDECHTYRGVFGSHIALVLRRLRRIAAHHGAEPVFMLASATVAEPGEFGKRLIGAPVIVVDDDASPRAGFTFTLSQPPIIEGIGEPEKLVRRTATAHAARRMADHIVAGGRCLTFTRSRRSAELVAIGTQQALAESAPPLAKRVAAYRAGYLAHDRRELEAALRSGQLRGVAATTALELGINLTGLDAVVIAGFPGTLASLWQQAGRAGRDGQPGTAELIARDEPLDTYLVHHPQAIFGRPVEATVVDPGNPYVLAPHLACAANELPLKPGDLEHFGDAAPGVLDEMVTAKLIRKRPTGWYWTGRGAPDVSLRGSGGAPVSIVDSETGQLVGTIDATAAMNSLYPQAVYLHQGQTYLVDDLDLNDHVALVHKANPDWTTFARETSDLLIVQALDKIAAGPVNLCYGTVDVTSQMTSFLRRRISTNEIIDETPLDLPERQLRTKAVWFTMPAEFCEGAASRAPAVTLPVAAENSHNRNAARETEEIHRGCDLAGSLHAAEHAAIGLLPLFATCDRWDIGGLSTIEHPDTGAPTIFVYDGHQGGAGFAERAFRTAGPWLSATRDTINECPCLEGCPACVYSPKCGNGNEPLDKGGAVNVLSHVVQALTS